MFTMAKIRNGESYLEEWCYRRGKKASKQILSTAVKMTVGNGFAGNPSIKPHIGMKM